MFIDYYAILDIDISASQDDIKSAFKKQAIKWHPDKNPDIETTKRMQQINEAYLILKDLEAKERYDIEYRLYISINQQKESRIKESQMQYAEEESDFEDYSYSIKDDILNNWMTNAKRQAVNLAKQTIEDLKGMVNSGTKAAAKEAGSQFFAQIIISIIVIIIFSLIGLCSQN